MGLDMFLVGKVEDKEIELGYWRKHPDLHGYIVQTFAEGVDECQQIPLTFFDLEKILDATQRNCLPFTDGFFFGKSEMDDKAPTIEILNKALDWLAKTKGASVYYRASW